MQIIGNGMMISFSIIQSRVVKLLWLFQPQKKVIIMALYKDDNAIGKSSSDAFNAEFKPGETPIHSGIYRCTGCKKEIVAEESRQFPPQNHHAHSTSQGAIRWKMIVYAVHDPK